MTEASTNPEGELPGLWLIGEEGLITVEADGDEVCIQIENDSATISSSDACELVSALMSVSSEVGEFVRRRAEEAEVWNDYILPLKQRYAKTDMSGHDRVVVVEALGFASALRDSDVPTHLVTRRLMGEGDMTSEAVYAAAVKAIEERKDDLFQSFFESISAATGWLAEQGAERFALPPLSTVEGHVALRSAERCIGKTARVYKTLWTSASGKRYKRCLYAEPLHITDTPDASLVDTERAAA